MPANKTRSSRSTRAGKAGRTGSSRAGRKPFWKDRRARRMLGLSFLLAATALGVALVSYLFTHPHDHDQVHGRGFGVVFDGDVEVRNALGRLGAWVAHELIFVRFGIPALFLVICGAATGANLLYGKRYVRLGRLYLFCAAAALWLSTTLSFLFGARSDVLGGGLGRYVEEGLRGGLGAAGTAILLVFALMAWAAAFLDATFRVRLPVLVRGLFRRRRQAGDTTAEDLTGEGAVVGTADPSTERVDQRPTYGSAAEVGEAAEEAARAARVAGEDLPDDGRPELEIGGVSPNGESASLSAEKDPGDETGTAADSAKKPPAGEAESAGLHLDIVETPPEDTVARRGSLESHYDPTLELPDYHYPTLELLEDYGGSDVRIDTKELERNKDQIIETLDDYGIRISKIKATVGPTVTLYEIVPAKGVRISKIKNLEDDIALSLAALGIRIIAPIPGKGTIGIEVPNVNKTIVGMKTLLGSEKFTQARMDLPICLGKTIASENYVADLARMPHLLIAGATGQGKSVGINALLVSLLYKRHPSELKLVLIDPKKVELSLFHRIERHFLAKLPGEEEPIVTDTRKVIATLHSLCIEMDQRYDLLKKAGARNIKEYNKKFLDRKLNPQNGHRFMPFIVLVIDEFADLIMTAGKEIEMPLARLAQLARAVGIHLVIATQRPSVKIITGLIKANFPARIAFKVTAKVDSRTILDTGGADQLIGRGDMLLSIGSDVIRLQCPFVDTPEVERVVEYIADQDGPAEPFLLPEYVDEKEAQAGEIDEADRDQLFEDAARVVVQHQQGSTSLIQRRLKLGYNRAGRLMDQLEAAGVVGPNLGSKARDVLIRDELELEQFLSPTEEGPGT